MSLPEFDRSRAAWWAFGAAVAAALAFVVYSFVGTVVFGIFLYYATRPVYRRLRRRLGNRTLAAAVSLVALAGPALALVVYALVRAVTQAQQYVGSVTVLPLDRIPGVDRQLLASLSDPQQLIEIDWQQYVSTDTLTSALESLSGAADVLAVFGIALLHLFVMFVIAFYLLRDGHKLRRWVTGFGDDRGVVQAYVAAVDTDYKNIFFGNILNAAFTGTIGVVAYTVLNVFAPPAAAIPAAALVGLLAGVASLVPVVGMKLVYVPVALFMTLRGVATGATETLWFVGLFAAVSFVVVDTVPDLLLRPYVSGRSLHVGSVMLAYTLGPLLFGWYGIFLLPMLLVVAVQFARIVLPELVTGRAVQPVAVDPAAMGTDAAETDPGPTEPVGGPAEPVGDPQAGDDPGPTTDGGRPGDADTPEGAVNRDENVNRAEGAVNRDENVNRGGKVNEDTTNDTGADDTDAAVTADDATDAETGEDTTSEDESEDPFRYGDARDG